MRACLPNQPLVTGSFSQASSRFEIHADLGPQTLARIVGVFAAQNLVPADLRARQSCAGMWIGLHIDMASDAAERMAEKLRALVCVEAVILIPAPPESETSKAAAPIGRTLATC